MANHCKGTRGRKKSVVSKRGRKKAVGRGTRKLKGGWWWNKRDRLKNNIRKAQKAVQMCTPEKKTQLDDNLTKAKKALENFNDAQDEKKNLKRVKTMNKKKQALREQEEKNALRKATSDDEKKKLKEEFEKQKRIDKDDLETPGRKSDYSSKINLNDLEDPVALQL